MKFIVKYKDEMPDHTFYADFEITDSSLKQAEKGAKMFAVVRNVVSNRNITILSVEPKKKKAN